MKKQTKPAETIRNGGFKRIGKTKLYINRNGIVYNRSTDKTSRPRYVSTERGNITRAAAVLWTFADQPPRPKAQICHIDGNRGNLNPDNLKYKSIGIEHVELNKAAMFEAIRRLFCVDKRFNVNIGQVETRLYLAMIAEEYLTGKWGDDEFKTVLKQHLTTFETLTETAKKHGLTVRDTRNIIYSRLNRLSEEINHSGKPILPYIQRKSKQKRIIENLKQWKMLVSEIAQM